MKRIVALPFALLLLLTATPVFAADVDGKWTGMVDTPMGSIPVGFSFKADGASLTGTTTAPDGGEVAISDGKIDGNKISFNVSLDFGGMAIMLSYTGVVSADQIKLTGDFMGMSFEFTVQKAK